MEVTQAPSAGTATEAGAESSLSPIARTIAIYSNPAGAWVGLRNRSQWWFPLIVMTLLSLCLSAALYERAVIPMISEQWDQMVEDGRMTAEQVDRMEQGLHSPVGMVMGAVPQILAWPITMLLLGAGIAFGMNFILGKKLPFRVAFEVACWSSLVLIPASLLTGVLAWSKETMKGIHLGPGILVPMAEPPQKWQIGAASFLDAFGPFELWTVAVVIIGASTLSGAPRKSTLWVIGGLYIALRLLMAALAAMFAPGA